MQARSTLIRLLMAGSARRAIAVSGEVAEWLAGVVPRRRIEVSWNGIADPAPGVRVLDWAQRPRRVGCLGRLFPVKGFELAIEAVARCPELELEVVGEGPERPRLEAAIRASGAQQRIRLLGALDVPFERLASWRALLVTSHHEGNPISVMEAMALSTPVVAGDLRGVEEMLAGSAGCAIRSRDPLLWAQRLGALLDDEAGSAALARGGRARFLDAFTQGAAAKRVARIYRGALAPGRVAS